MPLCIIFFILLTILKSVQAQIIYTYMAYALTYKDSAWRPVSQCAVYSADFGGRLEEYESKRAYGCADVTNPTDGCGPLNGTVDCTQQQNIAIIARGGNCTFAYKALMAQEVASLNQFSAILIYTNDSEAISHMSDDSAGHGQHVKLPVFSISGECAKEFIYTFPPEKGFLVMVSVANSVNLIKYLIPFMVVVGVCFVVLITSMAYKYIQERRRQARRRLPRRQLNKLPTRKYRKGVDEKDTCAICLDDYENNDKLRILPCNHFYHSLCIDPWLTNNRRVCPVCKRRVRLGDGNSSEESEDGSANTTEREPLVHNMTTGSSTPPIVTQYATAATLPPQSSTEGVFHDYTISQPRNKRRSGNRLNVEQANGGLANPCYSSSSNVSAMEDGESSAADNVQVSNHTSNAHI